jgi:C-terminal processing protease CtpA/Prc
VTVVGQLSACTNGTVTSFWLPGNLSLTFTGMRLRNPDGSEFHGIGVVPDIEVQPTAAQFAAGEDPELQAAVDLILGR